jgi:putative transposase
MEIHAWAVLPNHYHLLVHVTEFGVLGDVFRLVHGPTAREWNLQDDALGRKVWYRFADRAIRSERHFYTSLNYIHYNAVKHGWVKSPYDWDPSSVHWYLAHEGREWLRDSWVRYPVRDYGQGWDE